MTAFNFLNRSSFSPLGDKKESKSNDKCFIYKCGWIRSYIVDNVGIDRLEEFV